MSKRNKRFLFFINPTLIILFSVFVSNITTENISYQAFLDDLAKSESGGRYDVENSGHYLGKYQMGEAALIDLGYFQSTDNIFDNNYIGKWTGKNGVTSKNAFLKNPKAQEDAVREYMKVLWGYLKSNNSTNYNGKIINGIKITKSGLLGASFLVGAADIKTYLTTYGKVVSKDGNGVSLETYLKKFADYHTPFDNGLKKSSLY